MATRYNTQTTAQSVRFSVDVNPHFQDKVKPGDKRFYKFNMSFATLDLSVCQLIKHIQQGHAWTAPHRKKRWPDRKTYRLKRNVTGVQVSALDLETEDERSSLDVLARVPFIARHAALIHTTASHTEEDPRARVVFVLSEALPPEEAQLFTKALLEMFPYADQSASDISRVFYGARGCEVMRLDNVLDVEVARQEVVAPYVAKLDALAAERERQRQERLQNSTPAPEANGGQKAQYVQRALEGVLDDVANAAPGNRHHTTVKASTRLASLQNATWLDEEAARVLSNWKDQLLAAAHANDYTQTYGEDEVLRIMDSADDTPGADEPIWNDSQDFFTAGDSVRVLRGQDVLARGTIEHMRQAPGGYWEAKVARVWYPRDWLRHATTDSHMVSEGTPQLNAANTTAALIPVTPESHAEREFYQQDLVDVNLEEVTATTPPVWKVDHNDALISHFKEAPAAPPNWPDEDEDSVLFVPEGEEDELASALFADMLDGRLRNIFAGLVRGAALEVEVPEGDYLTDAVLPYENLPRYAALNANTGTGKTTYARHIPGQKIILTSTTPAAGQVDEAYQREGVTVHRHHSGHHEATPDSEIITACYEGFKSLLNIVDASRYYLIIDESHNFAASSHKHFRGAALERIMDALPGAWRGVVLMTGTPAPLSHPTMAHFTQVNVRSFVRGQQAQRVIWKDANGKGHLLNSVLDLCHKDQTHLIYLNDKRTRLDKVVAGLRARGFTQDQVAVLNADNKNEATGRAIVEEERVPEGVRVLIVTHIFVESVNLLDAFDNVHLLTHTHPYLAQQLVNRLRTEAAGCVYFYNSEEGRGYEVDLERTQAHNLREARQRSQDLRLLPEVDPNDDSMDAVQARKSMRRWQTAAGYLVRVDENLEGKRWYDVSYLGVDNATFEDVTDYTHRNPIAFKNETLRYGWTWKPDLLCIRTSVDAITKAKQEELATQLREERELAHQERLATIRDMGEPLARDAARRHEDALLMKTAQDVASMLDAIDAQQDQHQAFLKACDLVEEAKDSRRKLNRTRRQIKFQRLAHEGDKFTQKMFATFQPGERLTSEEVHERVLDTYNSHEVMKLYAKPVLRYYYSATPESPVTARKAVEVLRDLYDVKRTTVRGKEGAPVNVYEVIGQHATSALCIHFSSSNIKPTKVNTAAQRSPLNVFTLADKPENEGQDWREGGKLAGKVLSGTATQDELALYSLYKTHMRADLATVHERAIKALEELGVST